MVAQTAIKAVANANAYTRCTPGLCLKYTRTWLEIGPQQATASAAWDAAVRKHPGDTSVPKGAPVLWKGGSKGYGHIALSVGNGMCRSTDVPSGGYVRTVEIAWITAHWGQQYMGWIEDLNGVTIPYLSAEGSPWAAGTVYVSRLTYGVDDSDSVSRLRYRLAHHTQIPRNKRPPQGNRYGVATKTSVAYWQSTVAPRVNGPKDGNSLSNPQANVLFGPNYTVIEE